MPVRAADSAISAKPKPHEDTELLWSGKILRTIRMQIPSISVIGFRHYNRNLFIKTHLR